MAGASGRAPSAGGVGSQSADGHGGTVHGIEYDADSRTVVATAPLDIGDCNARIADTPNDSADVDNEFSGGVSSSVDSLGVMHHGAESLVEEGDSSCRCSSWAAAEPAPTSAPTADDQNS